MKEPVIPCDADSEFADKLEELKSAINTRAHTLVDINLSQQEFYDSGILRSAIESLRGTNAADMKAKREFAGQILQDLANKSLIEGWNSSGNKNRFDYTINLKSGKVCVIELKGCLDGNNTNIYERPAHADEFVMWSVCQNPAADPRKNVWSGIHTRLSADIVSRESRIDGLIVWDMLCGKFRNCPKLAADPARAVTIGKFRLPPPCIYLFPTSVPSPRNNPTPRPGKIENVEFLNVLANAYGAFTEELFNVSFEVANKGPEIVRTTTIRRGNVAVKQSTPTAIKRK